MISSHRRREVESRGHLYQIGERARFHFSHDLAAVCLHRDLADAELAANLLVQPSGDDGFQAATEGSPVAER